MATLTKTKPDEKKKKKKSASPDAAVQVKVKAKKAKTGAKAGKKAEARTKKHEGLEGLARLVDHPLVADLLAAGAIAAVAAIAEHQLDKNKGQSSSKMVKSVGKAAAAAMGKRLFGDIGAVTGAAVEAAKKA